MIRHLRPADYTVMPWANGQGTTTELCRIDQAGQLRLRLSRAAVVADGAFSQFPGIDRNLTVLTGPGFDLVSPQTGAGLHQRARPLCPVVFAGDVPIAAHGVTAPCDDFNVMWSRGLPAPVVALMQAPFDLATVAGGRLFLYALTDGVAGGRAVAAHDLLETDSAITALTGHFLTVAIAPQN